MLLYVTEAVMTELPISLVVILPESSNLITPLSSYVIVGFLLTPLTLQTVSKTAELSYDFPSKELMIDNLLTESTLVLLVVVNSLVVHHLVL